MEFEKLAYPQFSIVALNWNGLFFFISGTFEFTIDYEFILFFNCFCFGHFLFIIFIFFKYLCWLLFFLDFFNNFISLFLISNSFFFNCIPFFLNNFWYCNIILNCFFLFLSMGSKLFLFNIWLILNMNFHYKIYLTLVYFLSFMLRFIHLTNIHSIIFYFCFSFNIILSNQIYSFTYAQSTKIFFYISTQYLAVFNKEQSLPLNLTLLWMNFENDLSQNNKNNSLNKLLC